MNIFGCQNRQFFWKGSEEQEGDGCANEDFEDVIQYVNMCIRR